MWEQNYFVQKRGVRGVISQKGRLEILQDVLQIEAFRTPDHVELTEFMAIDFDLLQNCAALGNSNIARPPSDKLKQDLRRDNNIVCVMLFIRVRERAIVLLNYWNAHVGKCNMCAVPSAIPSTEWRTYAREIAMRRKDVDNQGRTRTRMDAWT